MFGKGIPLFNMFGFQVKLDPSWFLLAFLIAWTLSMGFFPYTYPGLTAGSYLLMGTLVAIGLFASIVVHEFAHAWVARKNGLPMGGITLFLFGGVAEMANEAPTAKVEFLMALAGPLTSFLVMLTFFGLTMLGTVMGWPLQVVGVTSYLATLNGILILFNMVPAFPLDGGRILRAALWQWKKNMVWATRISSKIGRGFGFLLIILGILSILNGGFIGGVWWILIGIFVKESADMSYRQLLIRKELEGVPVSQFMRKNPVSVPADISLQELVDKYFYQSYHKNYPVVEGEMLVGSVNLDQIKQFPQEQWGAHSVKEVMLPSSTENTLPVEADATRALSLFSQGRELKLLVVVDRNKPVGVLNLNDLLTLFSRKADFSGTA